MIHGVQACSTCSAGKYTDASNQTSCTLCKPGYITNTLSGGGASACKECRAGWFSSGPTQACAPCLAGKYAGTEGSINCTVCAAGSVTDTGSKFGATKCNTCEVGQSTSASTKPCSPPEKAELAVQTNGAVQQKEFTDALRAALGNETEINIKAFELEASTTASLPCQPKSEHFVAGVRTATGATTVTIQGGATGQNCSRRRLATTKRGGSTMLNTFSDGQLDRLLIAGSNEGAGQQTGTISPRRRLQTDVTLSYTVSTTNATVAASMATAMSDTTAFATTLAATITAASNGAQRWLI